MKGIANHNVGSEFIGQLLIKNATKGVASNGNPFLTLILSDQSGTIEAKMWSVTKEQVNTFTPGKVVHIEGVVSEFRGKLQLNINHVSICEGDVDLSEFLESASVNKNELMNEIMDTISNMENKKIRKITETIIIKYEKVFSDYPASTGIHHAYVSGLAYHTVSMLKIAKSLCAIYPELNKDLLYAGVILHDVQKCGEYTGVISTERTLEGKLKGHLVMISEEIAFVAKELGIEGEEVLLLQHLMGSHHGRLEWQAFVVPQLIEAEVLHHIDNIDAKMDMLKSALSGVKKGEFTERLFGLDNRSFYKPTI